MLPRKKDVVLGDVYESTSYMFTCTLLSVLFGVKRLLLLSRRDRILSIKARILAEGTVPEGTNRVLLTTAA